MLGLLKYIFPTAMVILAIVIIIYLILLPFIAAWRLCKKVGIPGWKSLIPIYNEYLIYKIAGMPGLCVIPVLTLTIIDVIYQDVEKFSPLCLTLYIILLVIVAIINIFEAIRLPKAFGKGVGYIIGMIFLPNITEIILGMGRSQYVGNYKKE